MPDPAPVPSMIASIMIEDDRWQNHKWDIPLEDFIETLIKSVLMALDVKAFHHVNAVEVSVVLMNDDIIQGINKEYRQKDKPTNVLSFPQFSADELKNPKVLNSDYLPLGDILLAFETIQREAKDENKTLDAHLAHMIVHATLHLLGYDHMTDDEAEEMEHMEILFMENLGFPNPYKNVANDTLEHKHE